MDENFIQKYTTKLAQKTIPAEQGDCQLWVGTTKRSKHLQYGIICVKLDGRWTTLLTHRLIYMMIHHQRHLQQGHDVSHLCHNTLCLNPNHLSLEPHAINNNRQRCKIERTCLHHNNYADCIV